jgi:hypothetical protein
MENATSLENNTSQLRACEGKKRIQVTKQACLSEQETTHFLLVPPSVAQNAPLVPMIAIISLCIHLAAQPFYLYSYVPNLKHQTKIYVRHEMGDPSALVDANAKYANTMYKYHLRKKMKQRV